MLRKSIVVVFTLILVLIFETIQAQNLKYSVIWKGDSVGQILANRYDSAEFDIYKINSEVSFWFFGRRTINYDYFTVYKRDTLIRAFTRYTRNGDIKAQSSILLNGNDYDIVVDGNKRTLDNPDPIDYSVTTIYHQEPVSADTIFSERYGTILNIRSPEPNHYFIDKPDGRSTEYFFENGICEKVVVDNFFATFTFERSD